MQPREHEATRTLHLLRHAKSSWDEPALADRDRPLAPRGVRAAKAIAGHLGEHGVSPDLVLCSPAARTRQTLDLVAAGFPDGRAPRVEFEAAIYGATADGLLDVVRNIPGEERQVMLIGHQPALQDLAMLLCRGEGDRRRLSGKFPTAALATFAVPMAWAELAPDCARLTDYVKPRELEGS